MTVNCRSRRNRIERKLSYDKNIVFQLFRNLTPMVGEDENIGEALEVEDIKVYIEDGSVLPIFA